MISNLSYILNNYWPLDEFFLMVKIRKLDKIFINFLDLKKSLSFLVCVFCIRHLFFFYNLLLIRGNKEYINVQPRWSVEISINSKDLSGFAKAKLYKMSIIFVTFDFNSLLLNKKNCLFYFFIANIEFLLEF